MKKAKTPLGTCGIALSFWNITYSSHRRAGTTTERIMSEMYRLAWRSNHHRSELEMCVSYTQWLPKPLHKGPYEDIECNQATSVLLGDSRRRRPSEYCKQNRDTSVKTRSHSCVQICRSSHHSRLRLSQSCIVKESRSNCHHTDSPC